jgi:hypothetical protein
MGDDDQRQGYIKLFRKMTTWEWYSDIIVKTVFLHCLLKANYKDKRWKGHLVKRGQFITSYPNMAKECGISIHQARRAISALCSTGELTRSPQARFSIITVVGYDSYQSDGRLSGRENDSQAAGKRQQHKNIKNSKEEKEKEEVCPYVDENGYITDWDNFQEWKAKHPDWKGDDE